MTESTVRIGLVLPDVMGTYGDGGNAVVLRQRLAMRGIAAQIASTGAPSSAARCRPRWSSRCLVASRCA